MIDPDHLEGTVAGSDRRAAAGPQSLADMVDFADLVAELVAAKLRPPEPWLDKSALADHLDCSTRWVELRMTEGLPHAVIAGRVKFRATEAERWLSSCGHVDRRGDAPYAGPQPLGAGDARTSRPPTNGGESAGNSKA